MTRQKVKLAFIDNESARRSTYKKRKNGMLKKAHELATLCDVPVCVMVHSPFDAEPEVWPSREVANKVVSDMRMYSEADRTKKMLNQKTFLEERISKATNSWQKLWKANKEAEMRGVMLDCIRGKTCVSQIEKSDLPNLDILIDQCFKDLKRREEVLTRNNEVPPSSAYAAGAGASTSEAMHLAELGSSSVEFYQRIREQIENNLNMRHSVKGLDLNQKQW